MHKVNCNDAKWSTAVDEMTDAIRCSGKRNGLELPEMAKMLLMLGVELAAFSGVSKILVEESLKRLVRRAYASHDSIC